MTQLFVINFNTFRTEYNQVFGDKVPYFILSKANKVLTAEFALYNNKEKITSIPMSVETLTWLSLSLVERSYIGRYDSLSGEYIHCRNIGDYCEINHAFNEDSDDINLPKLNLKEKLRVLAQMVEFADVMVKRPEQFVQLAAKSITTYAMAFTAFLGFNQDAKVDFFNLQVYFPKTAELAMDLGALKVLVGLSRLFDIDILYDKDEDGRIITQYRNPEKASKKFMEFYYSLVDHTAHKASMPLSDIVCAFIPGAALGQLTALYKVHK